MYLVRPPRVYRWLFKEAVFRVDTDEPKVFLTFDDGPHIEATPFVLDALKQESVRATFFMLGQNALTHPDIVESVRAECHTVANHGMEHLNGWSTSTSDYMTNVEEGAEVLRSKLFRPAYGKMTLSQYKRSIEGNTVVLWDVISGDFDQSTSPEQVINNVLNNARNGSVIVMHDSAKAYNNLKRALPSIIRGLRGKGFEFAPL